MDSSLWHDSLYVPLLNFLFWLYAGPAFGSIGVAIIELTVLLRLALLPFTIVDERNRFRYEKLDGKIAAIQRDFKTDHVRRDERIRELLKSNKVNYWSRVLVLAVQLLVLVLLYQVFIGGLRFTSAEPLYDWVPEPAAVSTVFLGYDLAQRDFALPAIVTAIIFAQIYFQQRRNPHLVTKSDIVYLITFPLFILIALAILPSVKALFVLTSVLFGMSVHLVRTLLFRVPTPGADEEA